MRTLLVAIGNSLRGDDGAAHRVLELLGPLPDVTARPVLQLAPELAPEIATFDRVIFIDAHLEPGAVRLEPVAEDRHDHVPLGHTTTPTQVVALARKLYSFGGQSQLCCVPGSEFGDRKALTPEAEANASSAADLLRSELG